VLFINFVAELKGITFNPARTQSREPLPEIAFQNAVKKTHMKLFQNKTFLYLYMETKLKLNEEI
jgi:hypothetical protein